MANLLTLPEWTWDKLCAAYLVVRSSFPNAKVDDLMGLFAQGLNIYFSDDEEIPGDVMDVDVRRDYKKSGCGSATQKAAADYGITDDDLPGIGHLCQILADNNGLGRQGCGGYLKDEGKFPNSLVGLIRLAYRLPRNCDRRTFRLKLVSEFWRVVDTYFRAAEVDARAVASLENPFTVGGYAKILGIIGCSEQEVLKATQVFKDLWERVDANENRAMARAEAVEPTVFQLRISSDSNEVAGHLIETDDSRVAGKYLKDHPGVMVLVVRRCSNPKRYAIFCRGKQDFAPLYAVLEAREPGQWFLDERPLSPQLLNGSDSRSAQASRLKPSELIALIQERFQYTPRRFQ